MAAVVVEMTIVGAEIVGFIVEIVVDYFLFKRNEGGSSIQDCKYWKIDNALPSVGILAKH